MSTKKNYNLSKKGNVKDETWICKTNFGKFCIFKTVNKKSEIFCCNYFQMLRYLNLICA